MKALLLLALMPAAALAGVGFSVDWEHPTHNVDESEIPSDGDVAIAGTRVEWGTCDGKRFGDIRGFEFVGFPARTIRIDNDSIEPGSMYLEAGNTYCVRAFTKNRKGKKSSTSNVVPKVAVQP